MSGRRESNLSYNTDGERGDIARPGYDVRKLPFNPVSTKLVEREVFVESSQTISARDLDFMFRILIKKIYTKPKATNFKWLVYGRDVYYSN